MRPAWTCRARPSSLGGKPCGNVNDGKPKTQIIFGDIMEVCAACGSTKRASEIREAREAKRPLPMLDLMEGRDA